MGKINQRYTIDIVQSKIHENTPSIHIIDGIYVNQNSELTFYCEVCNTKFKARACTVQNNQNCIYCHGGKYSITLDVVKTKALEKGLILISEEYINSKTKMDFIDHDGYKYYLSYLDLTKRKNNNFRKIHTTNPYTIFNISNYIKVNGFKDVLISETYINKTSNLNFVCEYGHEFQKCWDYYSQGQHCTICALSKNKGENHYNWNPNLTDVDRLYNRDLQINVDWRNLIYARDNYTCVVSNIKGMELNAHHLNGYHWDVENRFNVDNGVSLSEEVHKEFHKIYGKKDNTLEQFKEFYFNKTGREFVQKERLK